MKRTSLLFFFVAALASAEPSHPAWQKAQSVSVPGAGLHRLDLPVATQDTALPGLEDLRLVDGQGVEQPFVIEYPLEAATRRPAVRNFRVTLQPRRTVLEMESGTDKPLLSLTLEAASSNFIKAVSIEGSIDRAQWTPLITDEMIFRQRDGAGRMTLLFSEVKPWPYLRATIRDDASIAVPFTGASIEWQEPRSQTVPLPVAIASREEKPGETRLHLDLGAAHLFVTELRLRISDPLFSRRVSVEDGSLVIASQQVHRLTLNGRQMADLSIPVFAQIKSREVVLAIANNDSPPLHVDGADAVRDPVGLAFHASAGGSWQLFSGNLAAPSPSYDLAALGTELRQASAGIATAGDLMPNPGFNKAATLPETGAMGASIDLKPWSFRKAVTLPERGVASIELDAETLAHAGESLSDLRLIQSGQQLPYIVQRPNKTTVLTATIQSEPDAKIPSLSRWRVTLPKASLPVRSLTLTSPTPVFERYLRMIEERRDSFGNRFTSALGGTTWSHVPAQQSSARLVFNQRWQGDSILIETDNGDNAPIQIDSAKAEMDVVTLVFKTTDPAPVQLYYGNRRAMMPRYDLRLVEKDLTTATPILGKLEPEEVLASGTAKPEEAAHQGGSPWLWVALGIVVVGLIAVMAKLLPKTEAT